MLQTENQGNDYAAEMQGASTIMSHTLVKRSFIVDAGGTFAIALLTVMLNAIVNILIARFLGPEGKGILTLVFLMLSQINGVLSLGVDISLIHYAGRGRWSVTDLANAAI